MREGVNKPSVRVAYWPAHHQRCASLQVSISLPRERSEEEHLAIQSYLASIKKLQELWTSR